MMLIKAFLGLAVLCLACGSTQASLVQTFQVDSGGTLIGLVGTFTLTSLVADGVSFDATLTVTGSENLDQSGGNGLNVDNGEFLKFEMAVSNEVGGTVLLDGFNSIDFNNFGGGGEGFLSLDNSGVSTGDNFFTTTTGAATVTFSEVVSFHAIANSGPGSSNSFRVEDVTFKFSGVPEPGAGLLFASALIFAHVRRRR